MIKMLNWKEALIHIVAIAIFFIAALLLTYPALYGEVLTQGDILHWRGMAQGAFEYKAVNGYFPLWNTHLFGGMPTFQTVANTVGFLPDLGAFIALWLPKPTAYFFVAALCFYILANVFKINYWVAVLVSVAYAFCSYNPVIIVAGHETKMMAIAYAPALLAGIVLIFQRKYILGFFVTALFATLQVGANHLQITYYLLLIVAVMTIYYLISWIKKGAFKHAFVALFLSALAGLIGFANSATTLLTTAEFSKYTMRGGKSLNIEQSSGKATEIATPTKGLDTDYAFLWSMHKAEPLQLLMPKAFGESSSKTFEDSETMPSRLSELGYPAEAAGQLPKYWGGLESTAGPVYIGAIIAILAFLGFCLRLRHSIWILIASLLGIVLAWGKYFDLNHFFFEYLPLYNKFRAPSMALVILQILLPLMAGITLQKLLFEKDSYAFIQKNIKNILYAMAGLLVFLLLVYVANDYKAMVDNYLEQAGGDRLLNILIEERKGIFASSITTVLLFIAYLLVLLYLFAKNKIKPLVVVAALFVVNTVDVLLLDKSYLNASMFSTQQEVDNKTFELKPFDKQILQDQDPHYRVLNLSNGDPFQDAITSYHHRSIAGYHPAKLSIYQDLIQGQMSRNLNPAVLNMLDTRYIVTEKGEVMTNPEALGSVWFVKDIQWMPTAAAELNALSNFNPKTTAIVQESFKEKIPATIQWDSLATIALKKYDNDEITYTSNAATPQFAVFSEVYYPAGWNVYVNGQRGEYVKTNYALRGMYLPAGKNEVTFKFEPVSVSRGNTLVWIGNVALLLAFLLFLYAIFLPKKNEFTTKEKTIL